MPVKRVCSTFEALRSAVALFLTVAVVAFPGPAAAVVTTTLRTVSYSPTIPTSVFSVTFPFNAKNQIQVFNTLILGNIDTTLTQGVDYTVVIGLGLNNGIVTTTVAVTNAYTLTIFRVTPQTQTIRFTTQGQYNPKVHEDMADKLTFLIQETRAAAGTSGDTAVETHVGNADDHTQYAILAGRASGQHLKGGTATGESLQLSSTAHATKGKVLIGSGGTELVVDDVNDYVGIGTSTPGVELDVVGDVEINGATVLNEGGADKDTRIEGDTEVNLLFVNAGTNRVGIGTSTPDVELDVIGDLHVDTTAILNAAGGDNDTLIKGDSVTYLLFVDASTDRIGIGTSTPSTTLDVIGDLEVNGATVLNEGGADKDTRIEGNTEVNLLFVDASTDRIGIGTATPGYELDVVGDVRITETEGIIIDVGPFGSVIHLTQDDRALAFYGGATASTGAKLILNGESASSYADYIQLTSDRVELRDVSGSLYGYLDDDGHSLGPTGMLNLLTTAGIAESVANTDCNTTYLCPINNTIVQLQNVASANVGCSITLVNTQVAGGIVTLSPHNTDGIGGTCSTSVVDRVMTRVVNLDVISKNAVSQKGDSITVISDGITLWYITSCQGEWNN